MPSLAQPALKHHRDPMTQPSIHPQKSIHPSPSTRRSSLTLQAPPVPAVALPLTLTFGRPASAGAVRAGDQRGQGQIAVSPETGAEDQVLSGLSLGAQVVSLFRHPGGWKKCLECEEWRINRWRQVGCVCTKPSLLGGYHLQLRIFQC